MRRIGMRTIKTLISIFICLMVFLLLKGICTACGSKDYAFLWYNPFFAAIATAYSIAPNRKKSIEQATNRCVASLIGGFVGVLLVVSYEFIYIKITGESFGAHWPTIADGVDKLLIPYLLVTIFAVFVVIIGVKLKKQPAIFVGILTFLSITINANAAIAGEIGEWGFGLNRILSTIIGVLVALGVNLFRFPHLHKNKDLLFAVGLDGVIQSDEERIKGYVNYELNHLHEQNINTTLFTTRTPQTFMYLLEDVEVSHPICCMSGAALYDSNKLKYIKVENIDEESQTVLDLYLKKMNVSPFKNYIIHDSLYTYIESIDNDGEKFYMELKLNAPYSNFVLGKCEASNNMLYYLIVERNEVAHQILEYINTNMSDILVAQEFDVFDKLDELDGYKYIKVYSKKVLALNILKDYCKENGLRLCGMSTTMLSNHLLEAAEIKMATYPCDNKDVMRAKTFDEMIRSVSSIYHNKKYQ